MGSSPVWITNKIKGLQNIVTLFYSVVPNFVNTFLTLNFKFSNFLLFLFFNRAFEPFKAFCV